jgi:peptidoglycan lytic transglycosylase D
MKAEHLAVLRRGICLSLLSAIILLICAAPNSNAASDVVFPRPAALEPNVQFWVDVFTCYSIRDFIIHDRDDVWKTYYVFHLPGSGEPTRDDIEWVNRYLRSKYGDILMRLASGEPPLTSEDRRVAALFKGQPKSAYAEAAQNLRVQEGLRERFKEGLLRSRYYWPTMERIFRTFGLPPELVTLAAVESGFQSRARSSAGAVGIWQFTRGTGRHFLRISRHVDERLSPKRATEAAAKLLRYNYDALGTWPLAITAYNYGTNGMARAASEYHNDYSEIFEHYNAPRFGFASKNYYAEFLAALQVHQYEDKYFPGIYDESVPKPHDPSPVISHPRRRHRHVHRRTHHHRRGGVVRVSAHPEHSKRRVAKDT